MRDFKDVVGKLNEFTSPDDIAAHFEEHEIKAIPSSAYSCAISEYVARETDTQHTVATSFDFSRTIDEPAAFVRSGQSGERIFLSPVAEQFIRNFDGGNYPNLISERYCRDA